MSTIKEVERSREQAYDTMLQEALSRPGVREAMQVYQKWREANNDVDRYRRATNRRQRVTTSDRTSSL